MSAPHTCQKPLPRRSTTEDEMGKKELDRSELWARIAVQVLESGNRDAHALFILTTVIHCTESNIVTCSLDAARKFREMFPSAETNAMLAAAFPHLNEFSIPTTTRCGRGKTWIAPRSKLEGEIIRKIARSSNDPLTLKFFVLTVAIHHSAFNIRALGVKAAHRLLDISPWDHTANMSVDRAFPQEVGLQKRLRAYYTMCMK